jgi:hypothetical protein
LASSILAIAVAQLPPPNIATLISYPFFIFLFFK